LPSLGEGVEREEEFMRWWADLVEKTPVVDRVQRRESECGRILVFKILEMVVGSNKKCKTFCLYDMVEEWIRSKMPRWWLEGMEGNLGIGVKDGAVGIHGENHIERLELLWGIKQAPTDMIGRVAMIPFQIQEPDLKEKDKKLSYLMFFCWKRETLKLLWLENSF